MPYKPLEVKKYQQLLKKINWNLYDENDIFICSIKIAHGKNTKEEVVAASVKKTKKACEEREITWPPQKKN